MAAITITFNIIKQNPDTPQQQFQLLRNIILAADTASLDNKAGTHAPVTQFL
ncbi:hypothetical protein HMPREF9370_1090 [Neisseria wadsworthii 9715]|uniref:Uncharacterized protein n=1 Tax=Neisseria wadsworthii 9715 TaxID=1030841 RepID=G4CPT0_9NEIS|nr:hypothetical protein HMPREF9370_1090 [Neisseria wadsworthii 9715]